MFTGLIQHIGKVKSVEKRGALLCLAVEMPALDRAVVPGASIAVNGVCLTAVTVSDKVLAFEAVTETQNITALRYLQKDDAVHAELSLRAGDELGGHFVTGHVDGVGEVLELDKSADAWTVTISIPEGLEAYFVPKGSVAVDGVSLTLQEVMPDVFKIALIPHTLRHTNFSRLRAGQKVNIEADMLAKQAAKYFAAGKNPFPFSQKELREQGF